MNIADYPDYIDYGGDIVYPSPFKLELSEAYFFSFKCDKNKLQENFVKWFDEPSGGKVKAEPILPVMNVIYCHYSQGYSTTREYFKKGSLDYNEVIFGTFVKLTSYDSGGNPGKPVNYTFVPFIYVDNTAAMAGGREVIGMPKVLARFSKAMEDGLQDFHPLHGFSMRVYDIDNASKIADWREVLRIEDENYDKEKKENIKEEDRSPFGKWMNSLKEFAWRTNDLGLSQIASMLGGFQMKFITLKQFRDFLNTDKAIFQALVEYYGTNFQFREASLLQSKYRIRFPQPSLTCDFGATLGIKDGQKALVGFYLRGGFEFVPGKEIWTSTPI